MFAMFLMSWYGARWELWEWPGGWHLSVWVAIALRMVSVIFAMAKIRWNISCFCREDRVNVF